MTTTVNDWQGIAATQKYFNSYSYDPNGNITNLVRKDQSGALMDQFTYGYGTTSNRLLNVADAAGATTNPDDIEPGQVANNYQYDLLGQLISDNQEGILNYNWRLSDRKLRSITGAPTKADVNFIYNPFGQRVVKIVKPKVNGLVDKQSNWIYTYYSYDANGQVMAVYDCKLDPTNTTLNKATLKEQHLYGSQRLGMVNKNTLLYQSNTAYTAVSPLVQNTYGNTNYELNNHLGNVNAVITDRRFWNTTTLKYEADVEMKNDYYPFGMAMKGRQLTPDYRYGYNGMELDNEVSGNGNSYTTEFRQYDPRLGRWKSLDPLMAQFPWQSPYCAFDNNPVFYNDPLGLAAGVGDSTKNESITETAKKEGKKIIEIPEMRVTGKRTFFQKYLKYPIKRFIKNVIAFGKRLDQKMKGNSNFKFGIEFKTKDREWNGNTANPVKQKHWKNVITIIWDDITDLTDGIGAIGQSSKRSSFEEKSKELVTDDQNKGKNFDEDENRNEDKKNLIKTKTSSKVQYQVYEYYKDVDGGGWTGDIGKSGEETIEKLKKMYPNGRFIQNIFNSGVLGIEIKGKGPNGELP